MEPPEAAWFIATRDRRREHKRGRLLTSTPMGAHAVVACALGHDVGRDAQRTEKPSAVFPHVISEPSSQFHLQEAVVLSEVIRLWKSSDCGR